MDDRTVEAWTFSPQKGVPGHGLLAQVWGADGRALATVEPTDDAEVANGRARLIAAAPDLYAALNEAPNPSKYHGQHGFEDARFFADYDAFMAKRRAALSAATVSHTKEEG